MFWPAAEHLLLRENTVNQYLDGINKGPTYFGTSMTLAQWVGVFWNPSVPQRREFNECCWKYGKRSLPWYLLQTQNFNSAFKCIGQFHSIQEKLPQTYILPQNSLFAVQHVCAPRIRQNLGFAERGGRVLRYHHIQSSYQGPTRNATCLCIILCVHTAHNNIFAAVSSWPWRLHSTAPDLMREFSMNSRRDNCVLNVRNMEVCGLPQDQVEKPRVVDWGSIYVTKSFNFVLQRYTANGQTHGCHVDRKYEPHTGPSWAPEADQLGSAVVAYRSIVWPDPTGHQLSLEYGHIWADICW
jgi:hypothetical protein